MSIASQFFLCLIQYCTVQYMYSKSDVVTNSLSPLSLLLSLGYLRECAAVSTRRERRHC